ncbi:hypothetical protein QQ045_017160 [Rhodiola kirilowii]
MASWLFLTIMLASHNDPPLNPALRINLPNKLVYEVHRYAFTTGSQAWIDNPLNQFCGGCIKGFEDTAGFLLNYGKDSVPLLVSEFGVDQRSTNEADNRSGVVGMEEMYGVLDGTWSNIRNGLFPWQFQLPQSMHRDPHLKFPWHYILYHPQTGNCAHVGRNSQITRGDCRTIVVGPTMHAMGILDCWTNLIYVSRSLEKGNRSLFPMTAQVLRATGVYFTVYSYKLALEMDEGLSYAWMGGWVDVSHRF